MAVAILHKRFCIGLIEYLLLIIAILDQLQLLMVQATLLLALCKVQLRGGSCLQHVSFNISPAT